MYLKSLEVQGFKSFANKIVFDFHNGLTGIVGPNGSGKSNVADAVRWVLGEQSAKQLRGASMQDVIFAGTENRKPLSYAYVAITLDNSDHQLAIDFEEVTIARRVYRSGESEYLINGNVCRLKEVSELFYDTGIGKEGYSIIGQGQIDRILSGKPEERRELFDEAAGIVKFKKRKATAQKKLENERENLTRVNDILSELERQVGPLERQSEKAKQYLKKKAEQKDFEVNMFLLDLERIVTQKQENAKSYEVADVQMKEATAMRDQIKNEYEQLDEQISALEEQIATVLENISNASVQKGQLASQIQILEEQIRSAEATDEHLQSRLDAIEKEKAERQEAKTGYDERRAALEEQSAAIAGKQKEAQEALDALEAEIAQCNDKIEAGKNELIRLLNEDASIQSEQQKCDTMIEQMNIRKAELNKRLLDRKSQEAGLDEVLAQYEAELSEVEKAILELQEQQKALQEKEVSWKQKGHACIQQREEAQKKFHQHQSRLESLRSIAERYDGYGNSIRKVMEQKATNKGICGVVSDLIQVDKKYEIAIETALGGNIQNIVTEDEATAKQMITFLKEHRLGRATFLPLTSVSAKGNPKNEQALSDEGVIGIANQLVKCDSRYEEVVAYLLGRVLVVDTIDHALALAKKNHYSLHIVTLEGEYLSPGGSMTGGAFKNSNNLLARNREVEELEKLVQGVEKELEDLARRKEDIDTARALNREELEGVRAQLQAKFLLQNTAQLNVKRAKQQKNENEDVYAGLKSEGEEIERIILDIKTTKQSTVERAEFSKRRKVEIAEEEKQLATTLEEKNTQKVAMAERVSQVALEQNNVAQNLAFVQEHIERLQGEIEKFNQEQEVFISNAQNAKADVEKKRNDIEEIKKTILASESAHDRMGEELSACRAKKEELSTVRSGLFGKQQEVTERCSNLDKEIFRLTSQREKLESEEEAQTNYMWEEYELTPNAAKELRNEAYANAVELKKMILVVKDEIRKLGDVNVNAIEEYKEVSERYQFLKTQHDDLIEAEQTLMTIIDDLDAGMRKQFTEKFGEIQREFDKSFKQLFGGGHGTLELVEDEDILECGIRIIAQPPGKKLQNMMQLSGGEKALTAIALLFAIQSLKPSPFCLLDEIEAALDDSNVTRFANYLGKLTSNTQFIVITHRRGTMTAADRLYGITMQEKGVSTLVSVNLIENDLTE